MILNAQIPSVSSGSIRRFANFKSKYIQSRNVDVWLPNNYDSTKKYAVLYMHDGQMLFDSAINWNKQEWQVDETIGKLIAEQKIIPTIVVGIWNTGKSRHSDYFPEEPIQFLSNPIKDTLIKKELEGKPQADNYLKFLTSELKPFIDSTFCAYKDRAHTFIAGSSMGGLISWYAISKYPKIFGGAACLSTHWVGSIQEKSGAIPAAFIKYASTKLPSPKTHKIYFDYGTVTLDSLYAPCQVQIDELMSVKGYIKNSNWKTLEFKGEAHTERAWSKRLAIPLLFLLEKKN
jgi:predicted alpha/beta superfamily hydrolase